MRTQTQAGLRARSPALAEPFFGILEAVVIKTYYADDPEASGAGLVRQVVCDLVTLRHRWPLRGVPVLQHGSAVANGSAWTPQPTRANLDGGSLSIQGSASDLPPSLDAFDGDRVLVQFIEGRLNSPIIMGTTPHPRSARAHAAPGGALPSPGADFAGDAAPDGNERWVGHQGTHARIDRAGNVRVDTTRAGVANDDTTQDATNGGHVDLNLASGASVVLRFGGRAEFRLRVEGEGEGQRVVLDIGKGADQRVVLGDRLMALFDTHKHVTFYGTTGPVAPDSMMAAAQADEARAVLSERMKVRS